MTRTLPTGVVTFLFTDIEGSTKLVQALGDWYLEVLADERRLMREVFDRYNGWEHGTEGDSFFVVFEQASDAVATAVDAQRALAAHEWPGDVQVRVRMGMLTGEPLIVDDDYTGIDVHRAARIAATGHGGQVLLARSTREAASLPDGVEIRDLGEHRLKDLTEPEWIYQLVIPGLPDTFAALKSLETPTNLPASATRLIGRERETEDIGELLTNEAVRLATLTGPGGTGKTRLALHAAAQLLDTFRNGVFFVSLASLNEADAVPAAIERALEITPVPGVRPIDTVSKNLRNRSTLLVLDNFEHVIDAGPIIAELLAGAPRVKALVTSRAPLHVAAEREYPLSPLATPAPGGDLAASPAVVLFLDRARAVKPDFTITADNALCIASICVRLDGLPLAIELAAARVKLLTPEQILARLGKALPLLTGGSRDLPARQQTLRGTIEWSYKLLDANAAALFRRLAVFVGGAPYEGVEVVADCDDDAMIYLETLVDHSLVQRAEDGRFRMLETIREFASEQLESSDVVDEVRLRHAEFCVSFTRGADEGMRGAGQIEWRRRLEAEEDNLRAALAWTLESESGAVDLGLRLAASLGWFWYRQGRTLEGERWLLAAYSKSAAAGVGLRATLAHRLGVLIDQRAGGAAASEVFEQALELYRLAGNQRGEATALNSLGTSMRMCGDLVRTVELYEESLALQRKLGNRRGEATALFNMAEVALDQQRGEEARAAVLLALEIDRELGDEWAVAVDICELGATLLQLGDLREAGERVREGLYALRELDDEDRIATAFGVLAGIAGELGEAERSARLIGAAEMSWETLGLPLAPPDRAQFEGYQVAAREALGPEAFERARNEGRRMTSDQAIAYALAGEEP